MSAVRPPVIVVFALLLAAWLAPWAIAPAQAATRAWLDRDNAELGAPVTLTIETDQVTAGPDYGPLRSDFGISGQQSSRQLQMVNGSVSARTLFGVVLTPRRAGTLTIPALRVGGENTAPLRLNVSGAAAGAADADATPARGDEPVFVETRVDDTQPYVQQSVGVVVRLYYATQLAAGSLELDAPQGASLQQVGDDSNSVQTINGRPYNVAERRYLLVPERSGALILPGARFSGRAVGGFFDDYFGRGNGELNARSPATTLQVRAQPDNAPQPWLPLRDLRLRYVATPQRAVAGEAVQVEVEATAVGATRAQFPELVMPPVSGAQVFPEPTQYDERFVAGSPQLKMTRRFSLVPNQPGTLAVPGLQMAWWDVQGAAPRNATLPDLALQVAPGTGAFAAAPARPAAAPAPANAVKVAPAPARTPWAWIAIAVGFGVLWLATLGLLARSWRRRGAASRAGATADHDASGGTTATASLADLRRALDRGGLDEVAATLCALAGVRELDEVLGRLASPSQRDAVLGMQRARWGGEGDTGQARQRLREAFREAPQWRAGPKPGRVELAPLYPSRDTPR